MSLKRYFKTLPGGKEIVYREPFGEMVFVIIIYTIGFAGLYFAIHNLLFVRPLPLIGLLSSLAWIAFISALVISGCRRTGALQNLINFIGTFVRNRFVEVATNDAGVPILCFGYKFAYRRYYFLKLRTDGINKIDWSAGQGNNPDKDNVWNVDIWFNREAVEFDGSYYRCGVYIVSPSGRKARAEKFGQGFIEFLKHNQIPLMLPHRT